MDQQTQRFMLESRYAVLSELASREFGYDAKPLDERNPMTDKDLHANVTWLEWLVRTPHKS